MEAPFSPCHVLLRVIWENSNHSQSIPQTSKGCCQSLATHSVPLSLTAFQELTCVTGIAKRKWWISWTASTNKKSAEQKQNQVPGQILSTFPNYPVKSCAGLWWTRSDPGSRMLGGKEAFGDLEIVSLDKGIWILSTYWFSRSLFAIRHVTLSRTQRSLNSGSAR